MSEKFFERLIILLKEDKELHDALVQLICAKHETEIEKAKWYRLRNQKNEL